MRIRIYPQRETITLDDRENYSNKHFHHAKIAHALVASRYNKVHSVLVVTNTGYIRWYWDKHSPNYHIRNRNWKKA